jgi:hypothetical protein
VIWPRRARLAAALWIVFALVVWNVVFDRVIVLAGRRYVHDAAVAADRGGPYLLAGERMGPAVTRGVRLASTAGAGVAAFGLAAVALAVRRR